MTLSMTDHVACLTGVCAIEEAETLLQWLRQTEAPEVDLSACDHLHAAVLQTLMAMRPRIASPPPDPLLEKLLVGSIPGKAAGPDDEDV